MNVLKAFGTHLVVYWLAGFFCSYGKRPVPDIPTIKIVHNVLTTQVTAILPALIVYAILFKRFEGLLLHIPNALWPVKICLFHEVQDWAFYLIHRFILHSRWGYKFCHHHHHEIMIPTGICALYGHWSEMVLSMIPVVAGPFLFGASDWLWELWTLITTVEAVVVHSPEFARIHPGHHAQPRRNFGLGLLYGVTR